MQTLLQDLRYGARMLLKQKGLTAIAVLSLALGIGANTALFSVVDAMLLKNLPVKDPDRLALFGSRAPREFSVGSYTGNSSRDPVTGERAMTSFPYQSFVRFREQPGALSDVFAFGGVGLNESADGQADVATFDTKKPDEIEIVGLARDAKYARQRDEIPPTVYIPWRQDMRAMGGATFEVRTAGDPNAAIAAVRQAVREVDGNLPLNSIKTQVEQAEETLRMERLFAKLLSLFGLLAQQLASIGLYGVMAYSVSQRTNEIGIRMALGADQRDVLKMILRQGMGLTMIGVVLGLAGAYVLTRYLESKMNLNNMLYGVKVSDPLTYGVIAVLLTVVAFLACFIPARRATKVEPMVALRCE